jgi:hypothetical protein
MKLPRNTETDTDRPEGKKKWGERDYFRRLAFSVTMRDDGSCVNVKNWSHVFPGDLNLRRAHSGATV